MEAVMMMVPASKRQRPELPVEVLALLAEQAHGSPPPPTNASTGGDGLSTQIWETLQNLASNGASLCGASSLPTVATPAPSWPNPPATTPAATGSGDLGSRLLESLRSLATESGSVESQQLLQAAEGLNASPAPTANGSVTTVGLEPAGPGPAAPVATKVSRKKKRPLDDGGAAAAKPSALETLKHAAQDDPLIQDVPAPAFEVPPPDTDVWNGTAGAVAGSDDEEGVPHRLPPGFGAIPQDLIEERARQREEERFRRLKATQPCRFGRQCKRRDCPNAHAEGRDIDTVLNPCMFGKRCKRADCFYDHVEARDIDNDPVRGMCKFGIRCRRPDCLYNHPPGREPVSGADLRICYFCHGTGHIAQDCPRNPDSWCYNREAAEAQALVVRAAVVSAATGQATSSAKEAENETGPLAE